MQTLFGEFDEPKGKGLKIVVKDKKSLSKNQQLFNRLTKRIENIEKENTNLADKLSRLLSFHGREISPLETMVAHSRLQLAMALGRATQNINFTINQTNKIAAVIREQCNEAFSSIEPSPEQEAFFDKWSEVSYKDNVQRQMEDAKLIFAEYINNAFGMDIEPEELDDIDNSPESQARFYASMKEKYEQSRQNQAPLKGNSSKEQLEAEMARKAEEIQKTKSLRGIYIALAKVLHPDTEIDPVTKAEKEEIMKRVTVAYEQKDLPALLKLELEWVHKTSEHLEKLTDEKLGIYISALRQQVKELEEDKIRIFNHPRYMPVMSYAYHTENYALRLMLEDKTELQGIYTDLNNMASTLEWTNSKKQVLDFVKTYNTAEEEDDLDDFVKVIFGSRRF